MVDLDEFEDYVFVSIGLPASSHSLNGFGNVYDLTKLHVADYSALCVSALSNAAMAIGSQSGGVILAMHCGVPTYMWGHEMTRHKDEENVHGVPTGFTYTKDYEIPPHILLEDILAFWRTL
jgi:hypothetical protein